MLSDPDACHVELPELAGPLDPEETRPSAALGWAPALDQLLLAHHPEHAFTVDRDPEPAADKRADHPVPIGLVRLRLLDDRLLNRIAHRPPSGRASRRGCSVQGLPTDPSNARHRRRRIALSNNLTRAGDALSHSHSRKSFPAISSSYVLRPSVRSSSETRLRSSCSPWRSCLPASATRPPSSSLLGHP